MRWWVKAFRFVLLPMIAVAWAMPEVRAEGGPPEGGVLPEFVLQAPQRAEEREYLGLTNSGSFKIPESRGELIVLELFSMYCPYCQKEAPVVNQLYQIVAGRSDLRDKVKIIGIGAGNSKFEVNAFKDLYHVPFPLFPDADFSIHKILGETRTPYFIVVRNKPGKTPTVVYSKVGSFGDPEKFLELILVR